MDSLPVLADIAREVTTRSSNAYQAIEMLKEENAGNNTIYGSAAMRYVPNKFLLIEEIENGLNPEISEHLLASLRDQTTPIFFRLMDPSGRILHATKTRVDVSDDAGVQPKLPAMRKVMNLPYGHSPSHVGDIYLPSRPSPPVVCLLHGGFWRMPYGKDQMSAIAGDLCNRGFAVWNIEYRRIGEPQVGWQEILSDVLDALAFLHGFSEREHPLSLGQIAIIGHSAGGQLALACTSQARRERLPVKPAVVIALAAINDLEAAFDSNMGNGAVRSLLGGAPSEYPDRYDSASPMRLLPHGSRQLLIHGMKDEVVPASQSRSYTQAARLAGDDVSYLELETAGHMDFVDPQSSAYERLCGWLQDSGRTED